MAEFWNIVGGVLVDLLQSAAVQNALAGVAVAAIGGASAWASAKFSGWRRTVILEALKVGHDYAEQKKRRRGLYTSNEAKVDALRVAKDFVPALARVGLNTGRMMSTGLESVRLQHKQAQALVDAAGAQPKTDAQQ